MRTACATLCLVVLGIVVGSGTAPAGDACRGCRDRAGGVPYDGGVCGPRVWGPAHDAVGPVDQCDACARFQGCDGSRQMPEMLAPWQLPPGRGFRPAEAFGYRTGPCAACAGCGPRWEWPRLW